MGADWKDMLSSLKENMGEVMEDAKDNENSSEAVTECPAQKGPLSVLIDRKGRKGKTATIIEGLEIDDEEVEKLASELKRKIGTGGSARGGEILLQGDWRDRTIALLKEKGYNAKA